MKKPAARSEVSGTNTLDMLDPFEPQRLSKIMAAKGLCSRREADYLIENGWVHVNGKVVDELGTKVLPNATIDLDARAKNVLGKQVTFCTTSRLVWFLGSQRGATRPPWNA